MTKNNEINPKELLKSLFEAIKQIENGWYADVLAFVQTANQGLEDIGSTLRFETTSKLRKDGLGAGTFEGEYVKDLWVVDIDTSEPSTRVFCDVMAAADAPKNRITRPSPKDDPDAVLILGSCPAAYLRGPLVNCRPDQILDAADLAGSVISDPSIALGGGDHE